MTQRLVAIVVPLVALGMTGCGSTRVPPTVAPSDLPVPLAATHADGRPSPLGRDASTLRDAAREPVWFSFDQDFITHHYQGELAFARLAVDRQWKVGPRHAISCGGKDGEVHVGVYEEYLELAAEDRPVARVADEDPIAWGVVIEPPPLDTDDVAVLLGLAGGRAEFDGYLRVWNEGHYEEETAVKPQGSSNPNHVLELHPAWRLRAENEELEERVFPITAIPGYRGYGLSTLKPLFESLGREEWLRVSRGPTDLRVSLPRSSNFFHLPVVIRSVRREAGGIIMTADVCSTRRCTGEEFLWEGLRLVSVSTAQGSRPFSPGERGQLLGLFSVNLKAAMERSVGAVGEVSVPEALEFFVFGRTRLLPVKNSRCDLERDEQ